jgi:anti-sigma regulatory factor (Ser/Thr protein kinase)
MMFTRDDLPDVRRLAASCASRAGMSADGLDDFVIAVNEVATNAVRHGSPSAWLRLWSNGGAMVAEVRDSGQWAGGAPGGDASQRRDDHGGMGLKITRLICDAVHIRTGSHGTAVSLRMTLR